MDRHSLLEMMGTAALGAVLVGSGALAQQKAIKDQLVGAWTLLLADGVRAGTQVPNFGPNPIGTLIFTPGGRYSLQIMRVVNRAPFGSNNRDTGTADENKAVAQGTISHFGTTRSIEAGKMIDFRVEGSACRPGKHQPKRLITAITTKC
jgi:hypothetical protein